MTQDRITDGDHSVINIDEALREVVAMMEEDFTFTLCSDSFSMLPTGEENRARSLTRIDLYQMRHVSMLHKKMIASLKQGKKMKNKSTMYNMTCDDEDHAIDIFPTIDLCDLVDSYGNLQLN